MKDNYMIIIHPSAALADVETLNKLESINLPDLPKKMLFLGTTVKN